MHQSSGKYLYLSEQQDHESPEDHKVHDTGIQDITLGALEIRELKDGIAYHHPCPLTDLIEPVFRFTEQDKPCQGDYFVEKIA